MTMPETTPFTIGADASCTDGACGKVTRVVVDPVAVLSPISWSNRSIAMTSAGCSS